MADSGTRDYYIEVVKRPFPAEGYDYNKLDAIARRIAGLGRKII